MAKQAVVIVGDANYLLPNVSVALSARQHITRSDVSVIVYVVAAPGECDIAAVAERVRDRGIEIHLVQIDELKSLGRTHSDKAVPVSALSRLWLHRFLDPETERFLYLDGDVMVGASLDAVFDAAIPKGGFLAAEDCLCLYEREIRQPHAYWGEYLQRIQVKWSDYFNTGVLLVDRSGWEDISRRALQFLTDRPELCLSSDQTALNVVAGRSRGRMPLLWNYQTEYMMVLDPREVGQNPVVWHFSGGPKPWDLAIWPWDESFNRSYREAEHLLAGLGIRPPPVNETTYQEGIRHRRRQRALQRWRFLIRRFNRSRKIKRALA